MAGDYRSEGRREPVLDGSGLRVAIACGRFNDAITVRLLEGAQRALTAAGVKPDDIREVWVPGAFELPLAARALARSGTVDAVVCVGAVIRGETTHYDLVSGECARGLQQVQLETGVPIGFGVATTENIDQALARADGDGGHNIGADAAAAAIEMAAWLRWL